MTSFYLNQLCQKFHFKYLITIQAINEVFDKDFFFDQIFVFSQTSSLYQDYPQLRGSETTRGW